MNEKNTEKYNIFIIYHEGLINIIFKSSATNALIHRIFNYDGFWGFSLGSGKLYENLDIVMSIFKNYTVKLAGWAALVEF
jgi:hypothetical protein